MSESTIEMRIPPMTAMASGCSICEPAPIASASGSMPATAAIAVIGGILISMVLSLVLTPVVHFYLEHAPKGD